jgi:diadenosine tetraphosphatase ApaH/serine/threonine PP2A family protein phosphatase
MRYAILADIHANLEALTAVLDDISGKGDVEAVWCLGDVVGYGPDPGRCIEILQQCRHVGIVGNHDMAAIGKVDTSYFNPLAVAAIQWTAGQLTPEQVQYLENLPETLRQGDFTLVHGSPMQPLWEYVVSTGIAIRNFTYIETTYCLVGHSHVPMAFKQEKGGGCSPVHLTPGVGLALGDSKMIINPGGVGQPRDGDPRASYAIYDSEREMINLYRVPYDIETTQKKIMAAGLPVMLASRLEQGR